MAFAALLQAVIPTASSQAPASAAALRARHAELSATLDGSPIQRGLHVESVDSSSAPRGDAYAVVDFPFGTVAQAFSTPASLCESLILHINVQYCRAGGNRESPRLSLALGKKTLQELDDTHRIELDFAQESSIDDYLRVELTATDGPLDTGNYVIAMELVALDERRSFMHFKYAYTQGLLARVATSVYFKTNGREKVGFSLVSDADGKPRPVRGIRGVLERNTMRYFLAFDSYLHALGVPAPQRFDVSLERWFSQTERFARQLHELDHDDYVAMKRAQHQRQLSPQPPASPPRTAR